MTNPPDHSTLEVHQCEMSHLPEVVSQPEGKITLDDDFEIPQAIDTSFPEVCHKPNAKRSICGMSRKAFWFLLAGILVITLGAAIGGGVGGALAAKTDHHNANSTKIPHGNDGSLLSSKILPNSRIATINYTDQSNTTHYRIFFQAESLALYQSDYSTSTQQWSMSPVSVTDNTTTIKTLRGSDIAAHAYWHSSTDVDFRLYFMDERRSIREFYSNLTNTDWTVGDGDAKHVAAFNSTLASYGRACSDCDPSNFYIYQVTSNGHTTPNAANRTDKDQWPSSLVAEGVEIVTGSSIATAPVQPVQDSPYKVVVYLNDGYLIEQHLIGDSWSGLSRLPASTPLEPDSGIAAIIQVIDGVDYNQVLTTTSNGIGLDSWNGSTSTWTQNTFVPAFNNIVPNSPIAANQEGRIYGWQDGEHGSTLTEWKVSNDGYNITFERVGAVGLEL